MTSDKYTKDFSDFSSYSYQGQILPNMFDHTDKGGDGQSGLQGMLHGIISAYGPAHIIDGIEVESGDPNCVTGTTGYYIWSGAVKQLSSSVTVQLTGNDYAYLSGDGTLNASCTGEWGSGVTIALSGNASDGIQDIRQVWVDSKLKNQYFERIYSTQITGDGASGFIKDDSYSDDWNGKIDVVPSMNALYDKFAALTGGDIHMAFEGWQSSGESNVDIVEGFDWGKKQLVIDINSTNENGATGDCHIYCQYVVPAAYASFPNSYNDLRISGCFDESGAGGICKITTSIYDANWLRFDNISDIDEQQIGLGGNTNWSGFASKLNDSGATMNMGDKIIVDIFAEITGYTSGMRLNIPLVRFI